MTVPDGFERVIVTAKSHQLNTGSVWKIFANECDNRFTLEFEEFIPGDVRMSGSPATVRLTFTTPAFNENYVRGEPCDVTFGQEHDWDMDSLDYFNERVLRFDLPLHGYH